MIQPNFLNLHTNKFSQGLRYYPFKVNSDRYARSCNTLYDLSNRVYVLNKTENWNVHVFNMIAGINESKTLRKHISCECKCNFDERKCSSNQKWVQKSKST